jgi:hypothetical protein
MCSWYQNNTPTRLEVLLGIPKYHAHKAQGARGDTVGEEKFGRRFLNLLDGLEWEWWIFEWQLVP